MKKIISVLIFWIITLSGFAQVGKALDVYFGINNNNTFLSNKSQFFAQNTTLQGLDSVQIRDILFGLLIQEYKFEYDARGNTTLVISATYDPLSGNITEGSKEERTYNQSDQLLDRITYTYNGGWQAEHHYQFYYTNANIDSIYVEENNNGSWEPYQYHLYSYNNTDLVSEIIIYAHNGSNWYLHKRKQYTYNPADKPIEELVQVYSSGNWENDRKLTYAYDNLNRDTLRLLSEWANNQWEYRLKTQNTFNSFDYLQQQIVSSYQNGQWVYERKIENTHDNLGVLTATQIYNYNQNTATWENELRLEYDHDYSITKDQLLLPFEGAGGINPNGLFDRKPTTGQVFQGSNLQHAADINFYFSIHTVGVEKMKNPFAVYPNPVKDNLNISGTESIPEKIEIYSITGNLLAVYRQTSRIDVSRFSGGIYLLKIYTHTTSWSLKFQKL